MSTDRIEELLRARARRQAAEPLGSGASRRLAAAWRAARTRQNRARRWRAAVVTLAAAAALLAVLHFATPDDPRRFGAVPLQVALLDATGRPLASELRGRPTGLQRPQELVLEVEPTADGFLRLAFVDARGACTWLDGGTALRVRAEKAHLQRVSLAEAAVGSEPNGRAATVSLVLFASSTDIPLEELGLPTRLGAESPDGRKAELEQFALHRAAKLGCTIEIRHLELEVGP